MSSWFLGQTDYLYFLYGLAFIGLGVVSYLLSCQVNQRLAWIWLALFGFTHGTHDWLDLLTIIHQDVLWLVVCRWILLPASFLFLAEFGRLNRVRQRGRGPSRWILGVLALLGCLGAWWGWNGLGATTRYALGLVGSLAAGLTLYNAARPDDQGGAWLKAAGLGFILYGLAIAATVPEAAFFPATVLNSQAFANLTGLPAVLLQTFLAVAIAAMSLGYLWSTWSAELLGSHRYRVRYLHGIVAALVVILTAGWVLIQFLGHQAQEQVRKDTDSRGNLIIQRLIFELEESEAAAKAMSGSPWIAPVLLSKTPETLVQANSVLDRYQMRFGASPAYILDPTGDCIASSNRNDPDSFVGHNYIFRPFFQEAMKGLPGRYFALGIVSKKRGFFAAHPVHDPAGKIVGVATIKNPLILFQQGLQESDPAFLIDEKGVIFLSSRPNLESQSLWPVRPLEKVEKLQFGTDQVKPVFSQVLTEGAEVKVEGRPYLFYRQYINAPGASGWSLVLLTPNNLVVFYRFLGIAITFICGLFTLLATGSNLSIREGEARFRTLFENMSEGVALHEVIYNDDGQAVDYRILSTNPAFEKHTGLNPAQVQGQLASSAYGTGNAPYLETYARVARSGQPLVFETHSPLMQRHFHISITSPKPGQFVTVFEDITERKRTEEVLKESEKNLRLLSGQLLNAHESERKRLSRGLHDELGHSLLALKLQIELVQDQLLPQQDSLKSEVRKILGSVNATIEEVRRLYYALSPGDLEDLGLTASLRCLLEDFAELQKHIKWTINWDNLDGLFPLSTQTAIYRVVQEALTNIGKHADPKQVSLKITRDKREVDITIEDDGVGFDQNKVSEKKTLGLLAMEERVKILGGSFELWSQPNRGTRITFRIPIPEGE